MNSVWHAPLEKGKGNKYLLWAYSVACTWPVNFINSYQQPVSRFSCFINVKLRCRKIRLAVQSGTATKSWECHSNVQSISTTGPKAQDLQTQRLSWDGRGVRMKSGGCGDTVGIGDGDILPDDSVNEPQMETAHPTGLPLGHWFPL